MKLVHTTASSNVSSIMDSGIKPRGYDLGNWYTNALGNPKAVYLSKDKSILPDFHGLRSAIAAEDIHYTSFTIDSDSVEPNLRVDENIYKKNRHVDLGDYKFLHRRIVKDRRWEQSITDHFACAHIGTIPPDKIVEQETHHVTNSVFYRDDLFDKSRPIFDRLVMFDMILSSVNYQGWSWHSVVITDSELQEFKKGLEKLI